MGLRIIVLYYYVINYAAVGWCGIMVRWGWDNVWQTAIILRMLGVRISGIFQKTVY